MTVQAPVPDYQAAREAMVDSQLRPQGVNQPEVLRAMLAVPREEFVPEELRPVAYSDRSIPLADGRMLAPATALGLLLTQLVPTAGEKALIVGAATGYSAAVLRDIGLDVTALESSGDLAKAAKENGIDTVEGALDKGWKRGAPYDLLIIDGAVEHIPAALTDQLADGGRFGAALAERGVTRLVVGRKTAGGIGHYSIADIGVPRLPGFERPAAFTF